MARGRRAARRAQRLERRAARKTAKAALLAQKGKPVKAARKTRRAGVLTARAGVVAARAAVAAPRARSPGGKKFRIRKGRKQRWSKKYMGWENVPTRRRRAKEAVEVVSDTEKILKIVLPLLGLKG